jgi:hypothetical protein
MSVPDWLAVAVMSGGTALVLAAAQPSGGSTSGVRPVHWALGLAPGFALVAGFTWAGRRASGAGRAALLGIAAGCGFGLTAAFMKGMDQALSQGPAELFSSWPTYATVAAGIGSLFLAQNALQAGRLVAAQPGLTLADPLVATLCGVAIFGEVIRTGVWFVPEVAGLSAVAGAIVLLARSPGAREVLDEDQLPTNGRARS